MQHVPKNNLPELHKLLPVLIVHVCVCQTSEIYYSHVNSTVNPTLKLHVISLFNVIDVGTHVHVHFKKDSTKPLKRFLVR